MMKDCDMALALFALGRFIDYRREEGMADADLRPFMQAYLNLSYRAEGLEPPDLDALRSRTVVVAPWQRPLLDQMTPDWLPDGERLRILQRQAGIGSAPCSCGPAR